MDYKNKLNDLLACFRSQSELASKLNVSYSTVSKWLSSEHVPHRKQMQTIDIVYQKFCNLPIQITLDDVI